MHVLVVSGSPAIGRALAKLCEVLGYETHVARSLLEAMTAIAQYRPLAMVFYPPAAPFGAAGALLRTARQAGAAVVAVDDGSGESDGYAYAIGEPVDADELKRTLAFVSTRLPLPTA